MQPNQPELGSNNNLPPLTPPEPQNSPTPSVPPSYSGEMPKSNVAQSEEMSTLPLIDVAQSAENSQANVADSAKSTSSAGGLRSTASNIKNTSKQLFPIVAAMLKAPISTVRTEIARFDSLKSVFPFALFVILIAALAKTIQFVVMQVYTPSVKIGRARMSKTNIDFSNLDFSSVLQSFAQSAIFYALIIGAIALVYFLVATNLKKTANFIRCLGIASAAMIPFVIFSVALPPLVKILYAPLGSISVRFGEIFMALILIGSFNQIFELEDNDKRIKTHLIALTAIAIIFIVLTQVVFYRSAGISGLEGLEKLIQF